jgi:hypothetical protein
MATDSPFGFVTLWEDFTRDNVTNLVETAASSATQDVISRHGGWWRQVLAGDDADALCLAGENAWEVDEGAPLVFETRLQTSVAASTSIFVGMSDANSDSVVIEDEDGTINTVATDAFGFLLEGEQDATWQRMGVQNDSDNTQAAFTGTTDAANSTTQTLRMEAYASSSGTVLYFIDGKLCGSGSPTSWFRSSIVYTFVLSSDDRGTAYNADYDYVFVEAPRS